MNFTSSQQAAIDADGNMIVVAGAGTGKTRTLVERCVQRLVQYSADSIPPEQKVTIHHALIVTFTEAAATEVRHRVRTRIEEEIQNTGNAHLSEQLELLETAHISTLHSFCFRLIRQHFYELGLDPGMSVLTKQQADTFRVEVLDNLFSEIYSSRSPDADAVRALLIDHFHGKDERVRQVILQLHHFTQTRPDPERWYSTEMLKLSASGPELWMELFRTEVPLWMEDWIGYLRTLPTENTNAHACAGILQQHSENDLYATLELIANRNIDTCYPKGKMSAHRAQFETLFKEASFLQSLSPVNGINPLIEDWGWFTQPNRIIIDLARRFEQAYIRSKHDRGVLDFHDLEQFALQLLWDPKSESPTELARSWQDRFKYVFVDEYQDINAAQDKIIHCLSRHDGQGNRFLVGDVKQSIYRFRQADPTIFRNYMAEAESGKWQRFFLSHNFRSEKTILQFVNNLFGTIMQEPLGGIAYDGNAALQYGKQEKKVENDHLTEPAVEIHLITDGEGEAEQADEDEEQGEGKEIENLKAAEKEALWIGMELQKLKNRNDLLKAKDGSFRNVEWKDMVILLRSLQNKVESYARVFEQLGIPLQMKRNSFYSSIEVLDLLNLLTILDNPLQDIPLLAVLRSPFCGLSASDLAEVRLALPYRTRTFWEALHEFNLKNPATKLGVKCAQIISKIESWRELGKHLSISERLEAILQETLYGDWVLTQPRGKQRQANVFQFIQLAREFDHLNGEGLYLFLRHIKQEQEASEDAEPAAGETGDAVRLISVHQSKGLEFPIVILPDLAKRFNTQDLHSGLILDETYGLCTYIKAATTGSLYPSFPYWLAQRHQRLQNLAEEMRVLYVALTRAQSRLILVASASANMIKKWKDRASNPDSIYQLRQAKSWLDWIGPSLVAQNEDWLTVPVTTPSWSSKWVDGSTLAKPARTDGPLAGSDIDDALKHHLLQKFSFVYPHLAATVHQAKSTVTRLRRGMDLISDDMGKRTGFARIDWTGRPAKGRKSGTEVGKAYHTVLEHVPLHAMADETTLEAYVTRLVELSMLTGEQAAELKLSRITDFWKGDIGQQILAQSEFVRRELPFTAKFSGKNLQPFEQSSNQLGALPEDEFIIVQGAVDLAVIMPDKIWLVDFKSDYIAEGDEARKVAQYAPQLELYALALHKVYNRKICKKWLHLLGNGKTIQV